MQFPVESISVADIVLTQEWNLHPWCMDSIPESLSSSLRHSGILHPPLLLRDDKTGRYSIVSGIRRYKYFMEQIGEKQKIYCSVLPKGTHPHQILGLLLEDQILNAPLSLAEKARFLKIATRFFELDTIIREYGKRLALPHGRDIGSTILSILDEPKAVIATIHSGKLPDKLTMELLSQVQSEDRGTLFKLFIELGMGGGKQRKLYELLRDYGIRKELSIRQILEMDDIQPVMDHKKMNPPQKVQRLGEILQNLLTPAYTLAEEEFHQKTKALNLPENYTIEHSPYFEKDSVTLEIQFASLKECQKFLETSS